MSRSAVRARLPLCLTTLFLGAVTYLVLQRPPAPEADVPAAPEKRPSDWGWLQRTFPHFRADAGAYHAALTQAQALRSASKHDVFGAWEPAGPTNIGGRIVDVAFDPKAPATVYAGAATGGVFKSIDGGATWAPIFDAQAVLSVGDLALDPQHPETLYVGTGEANGGHNNFAGGGVYKSTDGGRSWRYLGLEATASIGRILVDPVDTRRIFVAAVGSYFAPSPDRGLYRSDDGGETWTRVLHASDSAGVIDIVMRPDNPSVLLAATWERVRRPTQTYLHGRGSGLYRSRDGGDTWEALGPAHGLPDPDTLTGPGGRPRIGRIGLALCRDVPDVVYALYTDGTRYLGLYRSDDGGTTWRDADPDRNVQSGDFSWYFGQVRVHPEDPDVVYVMDVLFMRSADGGATWTAQAGTHVDHHALAFHPDEPDRLLGGNDGGLAWSEDGGQTWTKVPHLPVTQFYEIAIDPHDPARLYGGTQDNGTLATRTGRTDDWEMLFGGDGFYVNVDPERPGTIYVEIQRGNLFKSTDGGATFAPATTGIDEDEPRNWSTPVVMDPHDSRVLYYGTDRVYRTGDGAATWHPISPDLTKGLPTPQLGTVTTITVAPTDPAVLYAGTDDGNVWITPDGGTTWRDITGELPLRWITRVVAAPHDARTAYVTFSGLKWRDPQPHVFRTRDEGRSWQDLSANLPDAPVNAFVVDPDQPEVLYLGSDVGAFVSLDGGGHWEALGTGLPAVPVYDLKIHAPTRTLVAGTHGRSMYRLDLSRLPTGVADAQPAGALRLEAPYPNPFAATTTVPFALPEPGIARIEVFDATGRRVQTLLEATLGAGQHTALWEGRTAAGQPAASGLYFARLSFTGSRGLQIRTVALHVAR